MKIFGRYNIFARLLPVILSSLPFFVLYYFCLRPIIGDFVGHVLAIQWVSDVGFSFALIYFLMQLGRLISREFFEKKIFSNGLRFPTTNYLMHSDLSLSSEYTKKVHVKIEKDFEIKIPSMQEELKDEVGSRKIIKEVVALIREMVGDGHLVWQYNIEYGFVRNLIGGSIVAVIISIIDINIFSWIAFNKIALLISCVLLFFYSLPIIFSQWLIKTYGTNYAERLIHEYMGMD